MLSFRQKVLLSYLFVFLFILALLYPLVPRVIEGIQEKNLFSLTQKLTHELRSADSLASLFRQVRQKEETLFFRVNIFDAHENRLYPDSTAMEKENFHPEVTTALKQGYGYDVRYSRVFEQPMAYVAVIFHFQAETYVVRTIFPYGRISSVIYDFTLAFLLLSTAILLLFGILAWLVIHYLTRPVKQIIGVIQPFQSGTEELIPEIQITKEIASQSEFKKLAETLNALSSRIKKQIKTLTQEKNDKTTILESLGEGIIAVDHAMTVTYINHVAELFLDLKKEEILGKTFLLANQPQCYHLIHQAQEKKEPILAVLKPERKPKKFLDVIAVPRGDKGTLLIFQDKTNLRKIIELGRDFIANASHELKTPITIIRGFAETLHDHPELSREISQEITEKIVSNCQRMDTLVKNLLTLAAVDEGLPRSRLQECDLEDLVVEAKQTILDMHPTAQITITANREKPLNLMVDSDLFIQAILNLLDNAIKYSKPPAQVHVHLENQNDMIVMTIGDKGLGIPAEDLERIFERFYAVDKARSRSMGGSGLGLSIVERIVEKHQGKIDVTSQVGEGTTFTLTFPIPSDDQY